MSNRIANPFPHAVWAQEAYQSPAYIDVTMGCEWDDTRGELTTQPRPWHNSEIVIGSPGAVLSRDIVKEDLGNLPDEEARLNLAFMLSYMIASLNNYGDSNG